MFMKKLLIFTVLAIASTTHAFPMGGSLAATYESSGWLNGNEGENECRAGSSPIAVTAHQNAAALALQQCATYQLSNCKEISTIYNYRFYDTPKCSATVTMQGNQNSRAFTASSKSEGWLNGNEGENECRAGTSPIAVTAHQNALAQANSSCVQFGFSCTEISTVYTYGFFGTPNCTASVAVLGVIK
jgi:hypothetical protein